MTTTDASTEIDLSPFLEPGAVVDSSCPGVRALVDRVTAGSSDAVERAVRLYYAVRDEIRYDPYSVELSVDGLGPRRTLELGRGWCVSKAILLAACCRAAGVPARLGFADVRNHLSTEKMRQRMKTDLFYWHGYTSLHLEGKWVKATPAFNVSLCEKFKLHALEFDGRQDSIYHPFDLEGNRHMEYVAYRGEYAEPPIEAMLETFRHEYPGAYGDQTPEVPAGDFDREVEEETAGLRERR